ncbi:hypothetical protein HYV31_03235 [candidate division WWE3 bacterium]|nr:hypothetical protein [candidate division WWE3 bacterium]
MENVLKLTIHTDFMSEILVQFFKNFLDNQIKNTTAFEVHLPLESVILQEFCKQFIKTEVSLVVYKIYKDKDYIANYNVESVLEDLQVYDKCTFIKNSIENFDPYSYSLGKIKRDTLILENSQILILGETLISGKGMQLAEKALEKNKQIYCVIPDYFSFGFLGVEFLLCSNSAQVLSSKSL